MKVKKQDFLFFILAAFLILVAYGDIFKTFFQQDEWSWFGRYMYWNSIGRMPFLHAFLMGFFPRASYHFAPLVTLSNAIMVWFFGLNFSYYAATSLALHFLNTILIYYLAKNLTKREDIGFFAGLYFAINSTHYNAIVWIGASLITQGAALFSILSLIFFVNYLQRKEKKYFWFSLLALYLALGFRESAVFLFLLIPTFWFFFQRGRLDQKSKKDIRIFLITASFYFLSYLILIVIGGKIEGPDIVQFTPFLSPLAFIYQGITIPLKAFSQVFVFPKQIFFLAEKWVELSHPFLLEQKLGFDPHALFQTIGAELISYVLTTFFFLITINIYFLLKKAKETCLSKSLIFGVLLILIGVLPCVFLLLRGQRGIVIMIRPRDLYISSVGAALLIGVSVVFLAEKIIGKKRKFLLYPFIFFLFCLLFFYHQNNLKDEVFPVQIERSRQRKGILNQILKSYPQVQSKFIIYTESDTAYYGHAELSLPFQSGAGRSIMLWYAFYQRDLPLEFFENDFLYLFNEEGYREIQGKGFGYFHNFDKLVEALEENNLPSESVYAFSWRGQDEELFDITNQVRQRLKDAY